MEKTLSEIKDIVKIIPGCTVVYKYDKGLKRIYYSKSLPKLVGYSAEEYERMSESNPLSMICQSDLESFERQLKESVLSHEPINMSYRLIHKSGRLVWVRAHANYIGDMDDCPLYLTSIFDINEERENQQLLLDVSDRGIAVFDKNTKEVLYGNAAFFAFAGISEAECMGKTCYEVICKRQEWNPDECFCFRAAEMSEAVESYNPKTERYYSMVARATVWGEHQAIAFYMSDITDNKKKDKEIADKNEALHKVQEESIRQYKRQLNAVMRMNQNALATCRMNLTKNTCYNGSSKYPNLEKLYSSGTVDGYCEMALSLMVQEEIEKITFHPTCQGFLEAYQAGRTNVSARCHYMVKDNEERYVETTISMAENPITKEVEAVLYVEDITQRELNADILQQLMDQHYEGVVIIDVPRNLTTIYQYKYNRNYDAKHHIMDTQETVNLFAEKNVVPEEQEMYKEKSSLPTVLRELEKSNSYSYMFHFQSPNGEVRIKTVSFYYLSDKKDAILSLTEDVTDITRKQREHIEELKKEKLKVEQATEAKTAFFSNISHDMRTPLNGILGFTRLAIEAKTKEENHEYLTKILSSGDFLLKLINDTLDISKIENGSMTLSPEPVEANRVAKDVADSIGELAHEKGIHFVIDFPENDGKYILVDRLRLQQIFTNLLGNAVKFTPKDGKVDFIIQRVKSDKYGTNHKIIIKDNGIGMKKEFIPHAFEAFSQQEGVPTQKAMGTGLGLAIVKQLVELMNGHIDVMSEEGKGTQYDIYLPLEFVSGTHRPEETQNIPDIELAGKKILLCEDHPINQELAIRLLKNKGMIVTCADNGKHGVEIFTKSEVGYFDAILMDIRMPEMDGIEAAKVIRSLDRADALTVPIIAMTANAYASDKQESIKAGMNAHLTKPLIPLKMYQTIAMEIGKANERDKEDR